jgi:hypothetical protein
MEIDETRSSRNLTRETLKELGVAELGGQALTDACILLRLGELLQ